MIGIPLKIDFFLIQFAIPKSIPPIPGNKNYFLYYQSQLVYNFDIDYQEDLWAIEHIMKNLDLYTNKI